MGMKGVVFETSRSTRDLANTFREAAEAAKGANAKLASIAGRMMGNGKLDDYFTPTFDSPFDVVTGIPDFAVGTVILKFQGGGQGNGTPIHMYVFEQGASRRVELVSAHGFTGGPRSARVVRKVFEGFQALDPGLRILDDNVVSESVA